MFELVCLHNFGDHGKRFIKKVLLKLLQNLQENISAGVFFKKKIDQEREKCKALGQVSFREICEIYQNTNFEECLQSYDKNVLWQSSAIVILLPLRFKLI